MNLEQIITYILILGTGQGIFLAVFLFTKKDNQLANKFLGIAIFAYALDILNTFFVYTDFYISNPEYIGYLGGLPFIYSPSIYLYAKTLGKKEKTLRKGDLFHYSPIIVLLVIGMFYISFQSNENKILILSTEAEKPIIFWIIGSLIPFYGTVYIGLAMKVAVRLKREILKNYSNVDKLKVDLVLYLLGGIGFIWILELIQYVVTKGLTESNPTIYLSIYITISILIYLIAFIALRQPNIFVEFEEDRPTDNITPEIKSYNKSGLADEKANEILEKLEHIMLHEKPFLNNNLKAKDLADLVGTNIHNLSEVINQKIGKTFYDFINSYRINEVKFLIEQDSNNKFNLIHHAFEAGFSSKSSFNSVFKKYEGVTPSEFRKKLK